MRRRPRPVHQPAEPPADGATLDVSTIRLVRGGRVVVRLSRDVPDLSIRLHADGRLYAILDPLVFPLRSQAVPPGRYHLTVAGRNLAEQRFAVTIEAGSETEVVVR